MDAPGAVAAPIANSPVEDSLYRRLSEWAAASRTNTSAADPSLTSAVEHALYHEARLLDDRQYRSWLQRFTPDCVYWVPLDPQGDPRRQISYLLDDRRRMNDRIGLLETGWAHAQNPPSRTCRIVSNVEAWAIDHTHTWVDQGDTWARCSVVTWEYRRERLIPFVSRDDYVLAELGGDWRIRMKIVSLVDCDGDVPKFSFVL